MTEGYFDCSVVLLVESTELDFIDHLLCLHHRLTELNYSHELLLAVNGPSRFVRECLMRWPETAPSVKLIELNRRVSSAVCLQAAVPECRSELLLICGPYQQVDYANLGVMLADVAEGKVDIALPWRDKRVDPPVNRLQSHLFNGLVRRMTGMDFNDLSCMVRVLRKTVINEIPIYGDLYRYLPILAVRRGFSVKQYAANHHQERGRVGFFGLREYLTRLADLVGMHFTFGYARKPLRYFGVRGLILFSVGLSVMVYAVVLRVFAAEPLGDSGPLMAGLLLMVFGSSVWGIGLLGEILTFVFGRKRKEYIVEKILERVDLGIREES